MPKSYLYLLAAVLCETFGSTSMQASQQFTRLWPSLGVVAGFAGAFWFMSLTLRTMPLGVVYATWSGLGILLIAAAGWLVYGQKVDLAAAFGMALIVTGILVIHLFSSTATH